MEQQLTTAEKGSVNEVVRLAWPIVVSMLSYTAMGVTDTAFVSWIGKAEVGAVGLATMAIFLVNSFFFGLLEGVKVVSAQSHGGGHLDTARTAAWQGVILAVPLGLLVIALGGFSRPIFECMGGSAEVQRLGAEYFRIRVYSAPLWYVTLALCNALQGMGDTRTPMRVNLLANGLNIALDPLFIFGFGPIPAMGVEGAALATVLACGAGMIYAIMAYVHRHGCQMHISRAVAGSILRLGWPMGIRFALEISGWTVFTALMARMGEDELAANQIAINIIKFSFMPGYAISETACILAGNYCGARDWINVHRSFKASIKVAVVVMAFFGVLFWIVPDLFLACFNSDDATRALGRELLWVAAIFQVFDAVAMVAVGSLNGVGDTRCTMVVSVAANWLVMIPLAFGLGMGLGMGALGAWLAITADVLVVAVILTWRFYREGWRSLGAAVPLDRA